MKKKKEMDVVFLLDRSGSMSGSELDTIGGYNSYLEQQRKSNYNTKITTVLFDDKYELLHDRVDIKEVKDITSNEYYVRGCTALLDAIGITITNLDKKIKNNKTLFIITTDGLENASKEFTKSKIKKLIESHTNYEFLYIGANIDSYTEGSELGIKLSNIANYTTDSVGSKKMFKSVERACAMMLESEKINENWKESLEQ